MSSIFRAIAGRTSKVVEKKENVKVDVNASPIPKDRERDPISNTSISTSEDDLFSGLNVNNSTEGSYMVPCHHLNEIQDLDITVGENAHSVVKLGNSKLHSPHDIQGEDLKDDGDNDGPSAFDFMNLTVDINPPVKSTEKTYVASRPKNIKKKKGRSVKPGFGNNEALKNLSHTPPGDTCSITSETSDTSNTSDREIAEDISSKSSYESEKNLKFLKKNEGNNDSINKINEIDIHSNSVEDCNLDACIKIPTATEKEKEERKEFKTTNDGNSESIKTDEIDIPNYSKDDCSIELCTEKPTEEENDISESIAMKEQIDPGEKLSNSDDNFLNTIDSFKNLETNTSDDHNVINLPTNLGLSNESNSLVGDKNPLDLMVKNTDVVINETKNCNLKISEQDRIMAKLEYLQSQEKTSGEGFCLLVNQLNELANQWKSDHLDENSIRLKVDELRQTQIKLESNEEYDEAGEIDKKITDLMNQCDNNKYLYPLCDERFLSLMNDYENLCLQQINEQEDMIKEYKTIQNWFEEKNDEDDKIELKKLNEMTLLLKEKKLKVERDRKHKSLDKEHLIKSETVLTQEINKQTKELTEAKVDLLEKKTVIQSNIEELTAKLLILQQQEHDLTVSVEDIDSKLQNIIDEFQPRINDISGEKEIVNKEESRLILELEELVKEEETVMSKYEDISSQKEKKQETISDIVSRIEKIQNINTSSETEIISLLYTLDFKGLQLNDDVEYVKCKQHFEGLMLKLKDITNKVFADEGAEKRLQRSLNDLEAQLSELQKLKQVHIKERSYTNAKLTSDNINSLTSEGEKLSLEAIKLTENIKLQKIEIRKINIELEKAKKKFEAKDLIHNKTIINKIRTMNITIENLHSSAFESWAVGILELQLYNNNIIIHDLLKKHPLLSECNEGEEVDIDIEDIKNSLEGLEAALDTAVSEEDWERAEEINIIIEEKKKLLNVSL